VQPRHSTNGKFSINSKKLPDPPCLEEALRRVILLNFYDFLKKVTKKKFAPGPEIRKYSDHNQELDDFVAGTVLPD